jgi:beta-glucuronidase
MIQDNKMLYPIQNKIRNRIDLSGVWNFQTDPQETGDLEGFNERLPEPRPMAVPGSWNEQYPELYNYFGMGWYLQQVSVPSHWRGQRIFIRIGSANYFARVWLNGSPVGEHAGGHLPFEFDITSSLVWDRKNTIAIQVENHLMPTRVPAGNLENELAGLMSGFPNTAFDFFPYAGLHRPVILYSIPQKHIQDVVVTTDIQGNAGLVRLRVNQNLDSGRGMVMLKDPDQYSDETSSLKSAITFTGGESEVCLRVPDAKFWSVEDPHLYDLTIDLTEGNTIIDRYSLKIGIRTIVVQGTQLLLNGDPVNLKGFGRHEDFYASGRGLNLPLMVKDYALLKWVGANSYRTSHYPYSEEEMKLADREGFLIIDEIPAVSLQFADGSENIQNRLEQCKKQLRGLVARDKNHPSVIMWSIANEPMPPNMIERFTGDVEDPIDPEINQFFEELYQLARDLDPTRLVTLVGVMGSPLDWLASSDIVCINRYWGWYTQPGQPELGADLLSQELDSLFDVLKKPIIVSEFGADTFAGKHSFPAKMWSEEYQVDFLREYLDVADSKDYVVGMHVWNFADFQAVQSINRAGGMNLKGVFTRDRTPKMAAHFLHERWNRNVESLKEHPIQIDTLTSDDEVDPLSINQILNGLAERIDGKNPGVTKTLKFDVGQGGIFRLVIQDGVTSVALGDGMADATMKVNQEDAIKMFTGKLNPIIGVTTGRVKVTGDVMAFTMLQEKL